MIFLKPICMEEQQLRRLERGGKSITELTSWLNARACGRTTASSSLLGLEMQISTREISAVCNDLECLP